MRVQGSGFRISGFRLGFSGFGRRALLIEVPGFWLAGLGFTGLGFRDEIEIGNYICMKLPLEVWCMKMTLGFGV